MVSITSSSSLLSPFTIIILTRIIDILAIKPIPLGIFMVNSLLWSRNHSRFKWTSSNKRKKKEKIFKKKYWKKMRCFSRNHTLCNWGRKLEQFSLKRKEGKKANVKSRKYFLKDFLVPQEKKLVENRFHIFLYCILRCVDIHTRFTIWTKECVYREKNSQIAANNVIYGRTSWYCV